MTINSLIFLITFFGVLTNIGIGLTVLQIYLLRCEIKRS